MSEETTIDAQTAAGQAPDLPATHEEGRPIAARPERPPASEEPASPSRPSARAQLSGARKAAVFILSLDEDDASLVLRSLTDDELGRVTSEIARVGVVEKETVAAVLREFLDLEPVHGLVREGGVEQAVRLVERTFPGERGRRILQGLGSGVSAVARPPFAFLDRIDLDAIVAFLQEEHPQTLAVILAHMSPARAAEILPRLPSDLRREVLERIATLEPTDAEALEQLEIVLEKHLSAVRCESVGDAGGVRAIAHILRASSGDGRALLDDLREVQPELADEVGRYLLDFEDLVHLDDRSLQLVLRGVELRQIALGLIGASGGVREKLIGNLSRRAAEHVRAEIASLGQPPQAEIDEARRTVVRAVAAFDAAGNVLVESGGGVA